ncbi:MAG: hypothetical protein LUD81_03655, partial [Clostridiales bacterium]|nr:hypothetical protein [Clostridiales bacterium]
MFKTKAFEIKNKKGFLYILGLFAEAALFFACTAGFLLLYFSIIDKEYDPVYVQRGIEAGLVLGILTIILKQHKIIGLILNIICI